MSNRLKFFREEMAAFEGTADPRKAIENGYYIPEPRNSALETISRRLELRPSSTHLLIGGIGSGKTTQLLVMRDRLNKLEDTYAHYNDYTFSKLITSDVQAISSAGIGLVLVSPLLASYGSNRDTIEQAVNSFTYQPCFDVESDPDAYAFFENILKARASEGFIEQSATQSLIHYSGGVLRDLINLTQTSIEEAYLSDSENLKKVHVEAAVDSFSRAKLLGLSDNDLEIIKQVLAKGTFILRKDKDIRLLVTGRILEYRYPQRRYVVHPTLQPLIQKIQSL